MEKIYKVLVVDDSPFIYKAVKRAIEPFNFIVVGHAINGVEGISMYEKYVPDIITLDITMPIMDGIKTAEALNAMGISEKIIMMSAMGDEVLKEEAKKIGVKYFLNKPFKAKELLEAINSLLAGSEE